MWKKTLFCAVLIPYVSLTACATCTTDDDCIDMAILTALQEAARMEKELLIEMNKKYESWEEVDEEGNITYFTSPN